MPVTPTLAAQLNQQVARGRQQQQQGSSQAAAEQQQQQQQQQQQGNRKGGKTNQQQQQQPSAPALTGKEEEEEAAAAVGAAGQIQYIPEGGAVVVINVLPGSPAQRAGLRNLDILLEIDRRPIYRVEDAQHMIQAAGVGRDLEVKVLRRAQEVTLRVRTTDFLSLFRRQQASKRFPELKRNGADEGEQDGQERRQRRRGAGAEEEGEYGEEEDVLGGLSRHQHATKGRERESDERTGRHADRAAAAPAAEAEEQVGEGEEDEEGLGAAGDGQREDRACSRGDGLRGRLYC